MRTKPCIRCRREFVYFRSNNLLCLNCGNEHNRESKSAIAKVHAAIRKGLLTPARQHACVDCGKPALDYEHRDYTKPLDVVPVCRSCNLKRGAAFDSVYRPPEVPPSHVARKASVVSSPGCMT